MRTRRIRNANSIKKHNEYGLKKRRKGQGYDYTLLSVIILLLLFGLVMIFSSSYYYTLTRAKFGNDMYYFLKRQVVWAVLGLFAMVIAMNVPYKTLRKFSFLAYCGSNFLLVLVLIVGQSMNGSKRWLGVGSFGFQPSEIAKYAVILYLSHYIASHKGILKDIKGFFKCCVILVIPVALIGIANMSTAIVVAFIGAVILFIASPRIWYFVAGGIGG